MPILWQLVLFKNYRNQRYYICYIFLNSGDTYSTVGRSFRVGLTTVSETVRDVCEAARKKLQSTYMPAPTREICEESDILNCICSIDGKHVTLKCAKNSGSQYFSYLQKFSLVFVTIVGPDYKWIRAENGGYGKNNAGGIFEQSVMRRRSKAGTLRVTDDKPLPEQNKPTPHFLSFLKDLIKYAATPPNQSQRCILTDYFNNYNFSKFK